MEIKNILLCRISFLSGSDSFLGCLKMCFEQLLLALQRSQGVYRHICVFIETHSRRRRQAGEAEDGRRRRSTTAKSENGRDDSQIVDSILDDDKGDDDIDDEDGDALISDEEKDVLLSLAKSCRTAACELSQVSFLLFILNP